MDIDNSSNERCNITELANTLQNIMKYADETVTQFLGEDIADVAACSTEMLSDTFKLLQTLKKVASIPTKLFMHKFDRYCRGLTQIPLNKRQYYIKKLGSKAINKENIFILNVINRIEDEDKLDFLVKLFAARLDTEIDDDCEYRRLVIMVDRTMFADLIYLKCFVLLFNGICQRHKSAQHSKSTCNCLATRAAVTSAFSFSVLFIACCAATVRERMRAGEIYQSNQDTLRRDWYFKYWCFSTSLSTSSIPFCLKVSVPSG